jgi:hypothetical protein
MADDARPPPPERSAALPRRVRGASGRLTPGQLRRGFLPTGALDAAPAQTDRSDPPGWRSEAESQPQAETVARPQAQPGLLPRRAPGASAFQSPPQAGPLPLPRRSPGASAIQSPPQAGPLPLPRRSPGASAIQSPPPTAWRAPVPSRQAGAALSPHADELGDDETATRPIARAGAGHPRPPSARPDLQADALADADMRSRMPSAAAEQPAAAPARGSPAALAASAASLVRATTAASLRAGPALSATAAPAAPATPANDVTPVAAGQPRAPAQGSAPAKDGTGQERAAAEARAAAQARAAALARAAAPVSSRAAPQRPATGGSGQSRPQVPTRIGRPARRWRMTGLLLALVLVLATVVTLILARRAPSPGTGGQRIAAEAAVRGQAVAWITSQVGRDILLACDAVTCADLAQHGFPPGDLNVLPPTAPDPYGSELVIATAGIRSQFGGRLSAVYAPSVIASFGIGADRIDIRLVAKTGAAAFRAALSNDLLTRQHSGAQLLANGRITVSALARQQLKNGQVDLRLLTAIAFLSAQQPLNIAGFGSLAPGADPGVPLRYAYLAESEAGHLTSARYFQAVLGVIRGLRAPYVPNNVGMTHLPGGQLVLRIEFPAPSPLGLLQS